MADHSVGADIDGYCTKCRMILGHTILAMVGEKVAKVRCNTCKGQHAYKAGPPGTATAKAKRKPRATKPGTSRERAAAVPFEELFHGRDMSAVRPYAPRERFTESEIIKHATFGLGVVQLVRPDKIDVAFKAGNKTLVHGLSSDTKRGVSFDKPGRPSRDEASSGAPGTADKPPPGESTGLHVVRSTPPTELPARPEGDAALEGDQPPA